MGFIVHYEVDLEIAQMLVTNMCLETHTYICRDTRGDYLSLIKMQSNGSHNGCLVTSHHRVTTVVSLSLSFQELNRAVTSLGLLRETTSSHVFFLFFFSIEFFLFLTLCLAFYLYIKTN